MTSLHKALALELLNRTLGMQTIPIETPNLRYKVLGRNELPQSYTATPGYYFENELILDTTTGKDKYVKVLNPITEAVLPPIVNI